MSELETPVETAVTESQETVAAPTETIAPTPEASQSADSPFGISAFYDENGVKRDLVEKLPEEASAFKSLLNKYSGSEESLYTGIKHLQYMASQKGLAKPAEDAPEAEKANFDKMVKEVFNVPQSVEGYGIQKPEGIPDEYWDQEGTDNLLGILHKHNASPELVKELAANQIESVQKALEPNPEAEKAQKESIRNEIREAFGGKTDEVLKQAERGLSILGIALPESGRFEDLNITHSQLADAASTVTSLISEDTATRISQAPMDQAASFESQAKAIKSDPSNPYYNDFMSGDPDRESRASAEFNRLMTAANKVKRKANV